MTTTDNPIEAVRARLDGGNRWIKDHDHDDAGNVCIVGALNEVTGWSVSYQEALRKPGLNVLQQVCREQFPDRLSGESPFGPVPQFNDHEDTVWADVELVLDKASIAWDEQVRP